ncbi:hypothetical protein ASG21_03045 [Chryseobacterium sp. Leaf394]|nr:hypothetical protein ASG21_03045 [Chryseobacterium sp. Leaf394]
MSLVLLYIFTNSSVLVAVDFLQLTSMNATAKINRSFLILMIFKIFEKIIKNRIQKGILIINFTK